jgi:hypothetical protein
MSDVGRCTYDGETTMFEHGATRNTAGVESSHHGFFT